VKEEHPFDEKKIIEIVDYELTCNHSESRDEVVMQHEEVEYEREGHPFNEEKIIEVIEYEPMREHSESRDDVDIQHEKMNGDKEEHPFDEENIIEIIEYEPTRNHSESCDDAGMQQNIIDRNLIEILFSLSSWTDQSTTKNDKSITNGKCTEKLEWYDELAETRNEENLEAIDVKPNTVERDDTTTLNPQCAFPKSPTKIEGKGSSNPNKVKESSNRCKPVQNTETERGNKIFRDEKKTKKLWKEKIPNEDKVRERIIQKVIDAPLKIPSRPKMRLEVLAGVSVNLTEEEPKEGKVRGRIIQKVDDPPLKIPSKPKMRLKVLAVLSVRLMEEDLKEHKVREKIIQKIDDAPLKISSKPKTRLEALAGLSVRMMEKDAVSIQQKVQ